jgi:uncharacterized lipoprotein YddW (UPF0748 family)
MLPVVATATLFAAADLTQERFEYTKPLPNVPGVWLDRVNTGVGIAQQTARAQGRQARILWIDATANLERYNTVPKIEALVAQIKRSGFNTVVFDIKPISGQVVYPSRLAPKLTEWRGRRMDASFDPVPPMIREARRHGMGIYAALNAYSEGHQMFQVGPGYAWPDRQSILYVPEPLVGVGESRYPLHSEPNKFAADRVAVFTSVAALPTREPGDFAVSLEPAGRVHDGFADGGLAGVAPSLPRDGSILYARGPAAEFLRGVAEPGRMLEFTTRATFRPIGEFSQRQIPLMMNPYDRRNGEYLRAVAREVAEKYAFDGLIYDDRLRFTGMDGDFSPQARQAFERRIGRALKWPEEVFTFTISPRLEKGLRPGRYYQAWLEFRAERMTETLNEVRQTLQSARPGMQLGVYAGSWYGEYASIGSNWAGVGVESSFWFATPAYRRTGFADAIDFFIAGCYYRTPTIFDAMTTGANPGATIEAAATLSNRLVDDRTWTYAGIMLSDFKNRPDVLVGALQAALGASQGVMVFDLSHDIEPFWPVFQRAFSRPAVSPSAVPGSLAALRAKRKTLEKAGRRPPPIHVLSGIPGTGF